MEGIATYCLPQTVSLHSCLVASLVHFTPSDLDFNWMSHEKETLFG